MNTICLPCMISKGVELIHFPCPYKAPTTLYPKRVHVKTIQEIFIPPSNLPYIRCDGQLEIIAPLSPCKTYKVLLKTPFYHLLHKKLIK